MSKIIFLNGCGSAGKTFISHSIQHLSNELWLTFGVDSFINMIPSNKQSSYLKFIPGQNNRGPTMCVETEPLASRLFNLMPKFAEILASDGNNLIIDEVLFNEAALKAYVESLANHTVYYIGIFCDLEIMQEREILRRDRYIGLSNDQIDKVHQNKLNSYDLKVNTSVISPFQAARQIMKFIENNPVPQAFQKFI